MSWTSLQALLELLAFALAFTAALALVFTVVLALVFSVELELVSEIDFLLALFDDPFLETPLEVLGSLGSFTSWAFEVVEDPSSAAKIGTVSKMGPAAKVGSVSKEVSVDVWLRSIDNLSPEAWLSENLFGLSLVAIFSDTNEASTEASPKVSSEDLS